MLICLFSALTFTGCSTTKRNTPISINVENNTSINGNTFGRSALIEIGNGLWYDTTTRIVYWWNGVLNYDSSTTPSPYYAPNGYPYRYNSETNTFEEIHQR